MTDNTTNMQTMIYITLHRKLKIEQYEPHKNGGEHRWSGWVSKCSLTSV